MKKEKFLKKKYTEEIEEDCCFRQLHKNPQNSQKKKKEIISSLKKERALAGLCGYQHARAKPRLCVHFVGVLFNFDFIFFSLHDLAKKNIKKIKLTQLKVLGSLVLLCFLKKKKVLYDNHKPFKRFGIKSHVKEKKN